MGKPRFRKIGNNWVCDHNHYRYVFIEHRFNLMIKNYKLGGCGLTDKGLARYADVWGKKRAGRGDYIYCRGVFVERYKAFWPNKATSCF